MVKKPRHHYARETLEVVYETEGEIVYCWLYGPEHLVQRQQEKFFANFPYGKFFSKVIQRVDLKDGWVSVGLSRQKGNVLSQGGRSIYYKATHPEG